MRSVAILITSCALIVRPGISAAQWQAVLQPGDRIEITWPASTVRYVGPFVAASADSVWMWDDVHRDTVGFALSPAPRIRVHRGTRRAIGRRAVKGFLVGFGIGASIGLVAGVADPEGAEFFGGAGGAGAFFGLLLGAPGMVIGALAGISVAVWEPVSLSASTAVSRKP